MSAKIAAEKDISKGTVMPIYEWGAYRALVFLQLILTYCLISLNSLQ